MRGSSKASPTFSVGAGGHTRVPGRKAGPLTPDDATGEVIVWLRGMRADRRASASVLKPDVILRSGNWRGFDAKWAQRRGKGTKGAERAVERRDSRRGQHRSFFSVALYRTATQGREPERRHGRHGGHSCRGDSG